MTSLRDLNRAVQSATYPSHEWAQAVREMLNEVAERMEPGKVCGVKHAHRLSSAFGTCMNCGEEAPEGGWPYFNEPASEGAKAEPRVRDIAETCPRCLKLASKPHHRISSKNLCPEWTCLPAHFDDEDPAQSEPAATVNAGRAVRQMERMLSGLGSDEPTAPVGEMPVEIRKAIWTLHQMKLPECDGVADALKTFWLTHAAQPEPDEDFTALREVILSEQPTHRVSKPEPAAPVGEMPEAVRRAIQCLRETNAGTVHSLGVDGKVADALETFWRAQAAQPKVAMTEELEKLLSVVEGNQPHECWTTRESAELDELIFAVRAQASQPVRMVKVRALIEEVSSDRYDGKQYRHLLTAALAELDAAEGKVTG